MLRFSSRLCATVSVENEADGSKKPDSRRTFDTDFQVQQHTRLAYAQDRIVGTHRNPLLRGVCGFFIACPGDPGDGDVAANHLVFNLGVVGVSFFFVLSGFILTYN